MTFHIVSNGKYMVDVITRPTMGKPGFLGCRPIERTWEFKWGSDFNDRVCFASYELPQVKEELNKQNINYEVVTEVC